MSSSIPGSDPGSSGSVSLLSRSGPHPLSAYLKALGLHIAHTAQREVSGSSSALNPSALQSGQFVTPLLASFVARCITLEAEEAAHAQGAESPYPIQASLAGSSVPAALSGASGVSLTIALGKEAEGALVRSTLHRLHQADDPVLETLKLQCAFESAYATEVQRRRKNNYALDAENNAQLQRILDVASNLTSNAAVAALYRAIFKLMLANGCVESKLHDRNVDREIAAALESVFPQAGLNAFNMLSGEEKKAQMLHLIHVVLGIRLFNREIDKGGAGLIDVPGLATSEVEALYDELERESTTFGELCHTYADVLALEYEQQGSIAASVTRLQAELLNRRQYILLLHQLQHEVLESLDSIKEARERYADAVTELRTLVGLRTSVPKESVYPKFTALSQYWRQMTTEREMNAVRAAIFRGVLLQYRQSFTSNLLEEDIELLRRQRARDKDGAKVDKDSLIDFDEFVHTLHASEVDAGEEDATAGAAGAGGLLSTVSYRPVRLVKEHTPNFLSLPLEFQGYCPWTLVHRGGLLLPGNPSLGVIRVLGRHYSFSSREAMQDFCEDPEKYIEGVLAVARRTPALIHLLCLQPYIPASDISEWFQMDEMMAENHQGSLAHVKHAATANAEAGALLQRAHISPSFFFSSSVFQRHRLRRRTRAVRRRTTSTRRFPIPTITGMSGSCVVRHCRWPT